MNNASWHRLEKWAIVGDGLIYCAAIIPNTAPLTAQEVLLLCKSDSAVVTIFDAMTNEFIGMAYASKYRKELEHVPYGRRASDETFIF